MKYTLKHLCFTFDRTQVEQYQGLLENKEGNKNKEGIKEERDRMRSKANQQVRTGIRNKSINT